MRSLEWLFLLSFIPILLLPFIPQTWRRQWVLAAATAPMLVGLIHLAIEGWRIQLIPLYLLAPILLLSRLPVIRTHESRVRRKRGVFVSIMTALTLILCGIVAGWLLPVVKLPQPAGLYPVGIVDRQLVDEERGRRLMVSIWYPATQHGSPAPLTHHPDEVMTALGNLMGLPGLPLQHLRYFTLTASEDVPMQAADAPFPILVFSHGMVGLRLQNSSTLQTLASWGYVVVAIDHTDAAAVTVFPDGEARFYNLERFGIPTAEEPTRALMNEHVFPVWVADQLFVYDTLEQWALNDALLGSKLDLNRIGSFGHSFGGATALEVCRIDHRCRAAVNMDGALYGNSVIQPAVRPILLMTSADSSQYADSVAEWSAMLANAADAVYWLELPNSTHFSFTITQLLSPLLVPENFDPRVGLSITDKYLRAFFDLHLRGVETFPLGQTDGGTDVDWHW